MAGKNGELFVGNTRFALLYNVQGLKYTIGKQFDCRDCQGEFLFCKGNAVAETSHCRITCEAGGRFLVKDLQGLTGRGTFINGERIVKSMELKFGDYLSLGGPGVKPQELSGKKILNLHADFILWEENHCTFLFKEVQAVSESQHQEAGASKGESQGSDDVNVINVLGQQPNPLNNSLVLSKIFGYLRRISDVKICRLVCSVWKEEATKLLKKNAITVFKYPNGYVISTDISRLFSFVQEMGGFFSQGRFRVKVPTRILQDCNCPTPCRRQGCTSLDIRGHPGHKMVSDLTWFFDEGFPHPITKLSLKGSLCTASGRNLFLAVLQGASLTLEDLELDMKLDLKIAKPNVPEPFGMNFPALKKLSVSINNNKFISPPYGYDADTDSNFVDMDKINIKMKKWINAMITGAPALQSLKLNSEEYVCQGFAKSFLNRIISHEKGFPNLNSLNVCTCNMLVLDAIMKLPMLESLTLRATYPRLDGEDVVCCEHGVPLLWTDLMDRLLERLAENLKYLELTLPEVDPDTEREVICLPVFPKLKVFKLKGFYKNCFALDDVGLVRFEYNFPVLEHFVVYGGYLKEQDFFNVFFPPENHNGCGCGSDDDDEDDEDDENDEKDDDDRRWDLWETFGRIVNSVRFLEIGNLQNWSPSGVDKINYRFPNAFNNEYLEVLRAKAIAKPKWNWSKWCFVSGAEEIPVNLKKTDQIHNHTD